MDNIPGLVGLLTATGEVEVVNRRLLEYFGKTLEELVERVRVDALQPSGAGPAATLPRGQ